jgi:C4-dicarboxylate transporter, DctM subunit
MDASVQSSALSAVPSLDDWTQTFSPWKNSSRRLLCLNLGLLLAGSFLELPAAILILTPLLLPIVRGASVSAIHFGIIVAVNLSLGMYTPPFGLNLFSSQAIFDALLSRIYVGVLPFLLLNFAALMIITYVPKFGLIEHRDRIQ